MSRIEVHAVDHCNLACVGCNHLSPHLPAREYRAEEYIPWLERALSLHPYTVIAISGGEPFLHRDLAGFVGSLRERFPTMALEAFTNVSWLEDEASIDRHSGTLQALDRLVYSLYRPVFDRIGPDRVAGLLDALRARFPRLRVDSHVDGVNEVFAQVAFYEEPRPRRAEEACAVRDCHQLTAEGKVYRCTYGRGIPANAPGLSAPFRASRDIVFDLATEAGTRDYAAWTAKWPLDACDYCGCGVGRDIWTAHVHDPAIRKMGDVEYRGRLARLILENR